MTTPPYRPDLAPERSDRASCGVTRSGSETRKRTEAVSLRMTPGEKAELAAFAAAHGMSTGELLRACWLAIQTQEAIHAG